MFRDPPFRFLQPYTKILVLIMLMIISFLVILALGVAVSIPFFGTGLLDGAEGFSDYTNPRTVAMLKFLQIFNQFGVFILPAILFVVLTDDNFKGYLRLDGGFKWFSLAFGFLLLIVSLPFIGWLLDINSKMHFPEALSRVEAWMRNSEENAEQLTDAFLSTASWTGFLVNLMMIAVLAAIGEELIFRGILLRLFDEWTRNVHIAVFVSAFLFSALHLQFYGFFGRLMLGLILGYLFIWSGSLWIPVIVHFFNNAMAVMISFMNKRGIISEDLESFGTSQNTMVILCSFLLMIISMWIIYLHEKGRFRRFAKKRP